MSESESPWHPHEFRGSVILLQYPDYVALVRREFVVVVGLARPGRYMLDEGDAQSLPTSKTPRVRGQY